jgi:hypothetical protein
MRIGPVVDAMKPGFQGVSTHWNPGFMAFRKARRTRIVMLMILSPVCGRAAPGLDH